MFDESDPDVIDSNGQQYLVGYDDHGWLTIVAAEVSPTTGQLRAAEWDTAASFPPDKAAIIAEIINDSE